MENSYRAGYTYSEAPSTTPRSAIFAHPLEFAISYFILVSNVGLVTWELSNEFDIYVVELVKCTQPKRG